MMAKKSKPTVQDITPIWYKATRPDEWVTKFTVGRDHEWDTLLLPYDAEATRAHVLGLVRAGVMTHSESSAISDALQTLIDNWRNGDIVVTIEDEDCHTVIERWLIDATGETGKKVHTARSRNDQVLAAIRLWVRDNIDQIAQQLNSLIESLLSIAERNVNTFLPGYTHMQRAMPSTIALWAAGFAEAVCGDLQYLVEARAHINVSPLGSGAGYGVPHIELDRSYVAELLGFERIQENATTVQLSRGKLELGVVHALLQASATINRLSSDLVLYSTAEFDFLHFDEAHTTGSSIMPQKKNVDVAELARAAMHRIASEAQVLISTPANLSSGYHRDLQNTKEPIMRSLLTVSELVTAIIELLRGMRINKQKLEKSKDPELFATGVAMSRVVEGEPFRDAYRSAAQDPTSWEAESEKSISESYLYSGTPGSPEIDSIRSRLHSLLNPT